MRKWPLWVMLCLVFVFAARLSPAVSTDADQIKQKIPPRAPVRYLPEPPEKMTLCGEPVPLNQPFVSEQLDREFNIHVHDQGQIVMWMKRAARYFPYIEKRLREAGLPDDLKYLAVAESSLIKRIRSYAGAVGLWQFIEGTGKRYGLRRTRWFDDRLNVEKATTAAINYLRDLHAMFKSWPLAMAAYNCGEKRVAREMKRQGVEDYYHLYLPSETMRYVYRILAIKAILEDPARYGYQLPKTELYSPIPSDSVTLVLSRPLHLRNLALAGRTTFRNIKEMNPEIRGYYLPAGTHVVKVPQGHGKDVPARLKDLKPVEEAPPPSGGSYVVQRGDTLSAIARKNKVSLKALRRANGMSGSAIKPGQKLAIP